MGGRLSAVGERGEERGGGERERKTSEYDELHSKLK